jgi:hypothetical protein
MRRIARNRPSLRATISAVYTVITASPAYVDAHPAYNAILESTQKGDLVDRGILVKEKAGGRSTCYALPGPGR